jgi:hypothetical protein
MQREKEDFYNMVKESGELFIFFDDMTGDWKKDKVKFCDNYDNVMSSIKKDTMTNDNNRTN